MEHDEWLRKYIKEKLKLYWSPEQIAGRVRKDHDVIVCHETIYKYIYNVKPELKKYLRQKKGKYRRRYGRKKLEKQREEAKKRRIDTRPKIVEQPKPQQHNPENLSITLTLFASVEMTFLSHKSIVITVACHFILIMSSRALPFDKLRASCSGQASREISTSPISKAYDSC